MTDEKISKKETGKEIESLQKPSLEDENSDKSPTNAEMKDKAPIVDIPPVEQQSIASPPIPQQFPQYPLQQFPPSQPYPILPTISLVPQALRSALTNPSHRSFVLGLESDLLNFISSNTDSYLLSPMNSFYRLLTHKTAEYYCLGHSLNKEGNSIIVYKNFGVKLTKPQPLNSIPFQQLWSPDMHLPQTPHPFPIQMNHLQSFPNQQFPTLQFPTPQFSQQQQQQHQPILRSNNESQEQKKEHNPPKEFKLMKRTEGSNDSKSLEKLEDTWNSSDKNDQSANSSAIDISVNSNELETERASRESIYQKARERIFQSAGEEEEEDEEEDDEEDDEEKEDDTTNFQRKTDVPRIVPYNSQTLPSMPPSFIPMQNMSNGPVPFPYYQYPPVPGVVPGYSQYGEFDQSKAYYNNQQYNRGGYKKTRGGYNNNNNGYRRNNYQGQYNRQEYQGQQNQYRQQQQFQKPIVLQPPQIQQKMPNESNLNQSDEI